MNEQKEKILKQNEQDHHDEILRRLDDMDDKFTKQMKEMSSKIDPMHEVFTSVNGFNRIAVWIMKLLAGIGAGLVGLYALIELFKKLAK